MPRTLPSRTIVAPPLLASLFAMLLAGQAAPALAQQSTAQAAPQATQNARPPANVQSVEPGSDTPATNIPTRRGTQIVEHRDDGGQVSAVEVTAGGSHYTMQPNNPAGNAVPGSVTGNQVRGATWTVGTFDASGKRHGNTASGTNAPAADVPPPPSLPANASNKQ
jgi:hypothetical protein